MFKESFPGWTISCHMKMRLSWQESWNPWEMECNRRVRIIQHQPWNSSSWSFICLWTPRLWVIVCHLRPWDRAGDHSGNVLNVRLPHEILSKWQDPENTLSHKRRARSCSHLCLGFEWPWEQTTEFSSGNSWLKVHPTKFIWVKKNNQPNPALTWILRAQITQPRSSLRHKYWRTLT